MADTINENQFAIELAAQFDFTEIMNIDSRGNVVIRFKASDKSQVYDGINGPDVPFEKFGVFEKDAGTHFDHGRINSFAMRLQTDDNTITFKSPGNDINLVTSGVKGTHG